MKRNKLSMTWLVDEKLYSSVSSSGCCPGLSSKGWDVTGEPKGPSTEQLDSRDVYNALTHAPLFEDGRLARRVGEALGDWGKKKAGARKLR